MSARTCTSKITVSSAQDVADLALSLLDECRSEDVQVDWEGSIHVGIPLQLPYGSSLTVTGSNPEESAIIGGDTTFPLLAAKGSQLNLRYLRIVDGKGGGVVGLESNVTAQHCVFDSNTIRQGGAAIRLEKGSLDLANCSFDNNRAVGRSVDVVHPLIIQDDRGGALFTQDVSLSISACNFTNNFAGSGGAIYASHIDVSAASYFVGNRVGGPHRGAVSAGRPDDTGSGGAVLNDLNGNLWITKTFESHGPGELLEGMGGKGVFRAYLSQIFLNGTGVWDSTSSHFADSVCTGNEAGGRRSTGGCIALHDVVLEVDGGDLVGNSAHDQGGAVHVGPDAQLYVWDGDIWNNKARLGGAISVHGKARHVSIAGGDFAFNKADIVGGVIHVDRVATPNGRPGRELSLYISGGYFRENVASESGGALYIKSGVRVDISGGRFSRNKARYNGGCVWLMGSFLHCSGARLEENEAQDEGGGIYAQGAREITSYCDMSGNSGRSGSAIYAVNSDVLRIVDAKLSNNTNSRGGVVHVQNGTVHAWDVVFSEPQGRSGVGAIEIATEESKLEALNCTFSGWAGNDAMIINGGYARLDECNFKDVTATTLVYSTSRARHAIVRNSQLGPRNYQNELTTSGVLVNGVATCEDKSGTVCAMGCVPSLVGVLCRCYEQVITRQMVCLDHAGQVNLEIASPPDATYAPNDISYELNVSAVTGGLSNVTGMIWYLEARPDSEVSTSIVPMSGILNPGEVQTVTIVNSIETTAPSRIKGGVLARGLYPQSTKIMPINMTYYQCPQYSYLDENEECKFCNTIMYSSGIDCSIKGATVKHLPIKAGYWRQTTDSLKVKQCPYPQSCLGSVGTASTIRNIETTDDYCLPGSWGKYCAECAPGFAGHNGIACAKCDDQSYLMIILLVVTLLIILVAWVLVVIYLVGGVTAVTSASTGVAGAIRRSVKRDRCNTAVASFQGPSGESGNANMGGDSGTTCPSNSFRTQRDGAAVRASGTPSPEPELYVRSRRFLRRLIRWVPFKKLRIIIVVWQILTQFPAVAYVSYPKPYANMLSYLNFINLNFVSMFSVTCIFTHINFYHELLAVTLLPLAMVLVMAITFAKAYRGTMSNPLARQEAVARHAGIGLLVAFLILSSASTTIVRTFLCETFEELGNTSYLKADYSISCDTVEYRAYRAYALLMIVYYPIGIPVLFLSVLWANKDRLNPDLMALPTAPIAPQDLAEAKEATRAADPAVQPTRILWGAYAPAHYTYEVVECGRRLLLTSALVMIEPGTTTQCALACVFAFLSLVGFELIMPYTSKDDAWLYRMGCMVVFFSNFLALLMKAGIADERQHHVYAMLLVVVNVSLFFSIWFSAWATAKDTEDTTKNLIDNSLDAKSTPSATPQRAGRFARLWRANMRASSRGVAPTRRGHPEEK